MGRLYFAFDCQRLSKYEIERFFFRSAVSEILKSNIWVDKANISNDVSLESFSDYVLLSD